MLWARTFMICRGFFYKKSCSETSRFKVGSSLSFSNLEVSEIISSIAYCFLRKLKEKNFFNEIEYDKLYPSGFAPARI